MGKNSKAVAANGKGGNNSNSGGGDPLEFINKTIKALKYADENSASKKNIKNNDDDDGDFTSKKQTSSFHQLNKSLIDKSIKESKIYKPLDDEAPVSASKSQQKKSDKNITKNDDNDHPKPSGSTVPRITIENTDTLSAVVSLAKNENITNPSVLIFAPDTNPGGSKTASNAGTQEEAIVRTSTMSVAQRQLPYPIPDFGVAYVPHCQTILPKDGTFVFGAVCAALRNFMSDTNSGKLTPKEQEFLEKKIMSVLLSGGVQNGHKAIVLGAWGCGAFGSTDDYTRLIAEGFASCIQKLEREQHQFERIVFAIPTAAKRKIFEKVFQKL